MDDDVVAMDDILCERWPHGCTMCQRWPLWSVHIWKRDRLAIAASLCRPCLKNDPDLSRLDALLRQRYAPGRWGQGYT